jgi:hypothetical protein
MILQYVYGIHYFTRNISNETNIFKDTLGSTGVTCINMHFLYIAKE